MKHLSAESSMQTYFLFIDDRIRGFEIIKVLTK